MAVACKSCLEARHKWNYQVYSKRPSWFTGKCYNCERSQKREYAVWTSMVRRCREPDDKNFGLYGGRGIKVCDRWAASYENFVEDMGERPSSDYSIERIDVNGDYRPENCKWILKSLQGKNKRNSQSIQSKFIGISKSRDSSGWRSSVSASGYRKSGLDMLSLVEDLVMEQYRVGQTANADYNKKLYNSIIKKEVGK